MIGVVAHALIPALGGRDTLISEFKASLDYIVSYKTVKTMLRDPVSKNKMKVIQTLLYMYIYLLYIVYNIFMYDKI